MTRATVTTDDILDAAEERTGLTRAQLLVLVAKSATVRHLATHARYKDLFVLKGGTLLSNVYRSPRQSIADADYTYVEPENLTVPKLEDALTADGEYGFYLYPEDGRMTSDNDLFDARTPFSLEGIQLSRRPRDRELKVTVSVRPGEWLDRSGPQLMYHDPMLAADNNFPINGLTRDELAAEKLLGCCSKPLGKHLVDLAYLAREHGPDINHNNVAELVRQKFSTADGSYVVAGTAEPDVERGRVELWGYPPWSRRAVRLARVPVRQGLWSFNRWRPDRRGEWELYARYSGGARAYANSASECGTPFRVR